MLAIQPMEARFNFLLKIRHAILKNPAAPLSGISASLHQASLQGMFCRAAVLRATVRNCAYFLIRSLTPQQAAGNVLAVQFKVLVLLMPTLIAGRLLGGCVTYQIINKLEGTAVVAPGDEFQVGKTTLEDALALRGAPTTVVGLKGQDLLLYQHTVMRQKRLAVGLFLLDTLGTRINFSTSSGRTNYDTLALFFTPDRILQQVVFEKGTRQPYKKPTSKDSD